MEEDMLDTAFIWSDNWHIEDGKAWFVEGWRNALFCLDLNTKICEYIAPIPKLEAKTFRRNPRATKIGNDINCMPDLGNCIWIYQIEEEKFLQMKINNLKRKRVSIYDYWKCENRLYAVALGQQQILEINLEEKKICAYYTICNYDEENLERSVKVGLDIYTVSGISNRVYQFNIKTKQTVEHTLTGIEGKLNTICFDGRKFWLSGNRREIYVWDKENNVTEILRNLPNDFGMYDFFGKTEEILDQKSDIYNTFAFMEARVAGSCIWFIQFRTNQIIYVDINTYQIHVLEMQDERETKESLQNNKLVSKYLLQYLLEERYLGLFSIKNNWIVEIDTDSLQIEVKKFLFDYENYVDKLQDYTFEENRPIEMKTFGYLLAENNRKISMTEKIEVGARIYHQTVTNIGDGL